MNRRPRTKALYKLILLAMIVALTLACNLPLGLDSAPGAQPPAPAATAVPSSPPTVPASLAVCQDEACMAQGITLTYLVVTRPLFLDALIPFVNWKTSQGQRVGVLTVDWLSTRFAGRHMAESMKTGMHTLRKQTGAQYVLLVGDTEIPRKVFDVEAVLASYTLAQPWNVPTGFHRQLNSDPPRTVAPSDAYFVEDLDWDPQNTGINPKPDDLDTGLGVLDATLFLGRWPVRKPEEIAPIFAKTQRLTPTNQILFTRDSSFTPLTLEEILGQCPDLPFPHWFCYEVEPARLRLFGDNAPWLVTDFLEIDVADSAQIELHRQRLASFNGAIFEIYHGNYDFLAMPGSEELFTHDYRILIMASCMAFAFYSDTPDTYSEVLLKSPTGTPLIASPPNDYMFLTYLREGQTVGQAFWRSGETVWGGGSNPLLGDPSLVVMVNPPTSP